MNLDISRMRRLTAHGYDLEKLAPDLFNEHGTAGYHEDFGSYNGKQGRPVEWTIPKFERVKTLGNQKQGTLKGGRNRLQAM